jgi:hypothetical protein
MKDLAGSAVSSKRSTPSKNLGKPEWRPWPFAAGF